MTEFEISCPASIAKAKNQIAAGETGAKVIELATDEDQHESEQANHGAVLLRP